MGAAGGISCSRCERQGGPDRARISAEAAINFTPLVSIIIPAYNGANYLAEAIDSALGQTYPHCEVLVVNDGSCDGGATERIALGYGENIRYFAQPNGGVAAALNTGIRELRGEYFSWLSHDDVYLPDKVQAQVAWYAAHPEAQANGLLFADYCEINAGGEVLKPRVLGELPSPVDDIYWRLLCTYPVNGCTLLIPRACFDSAGTFNQQLRTTQDYDLWFQFARRFTYYYLPQVVLKSRVHPEQGSKSLAVHAAECTELYRRALQGLTDEELAAAGGGARGYLAAARALGFRKRMPDACRAALGLAAGRLGEYGLGERLRLRYELCRLAAMNRALPLALALYRSWRSVTRA